MLLPGTIFASVLSMFSAYYATNPGYVDLDSSVCTPYGKSVLESDDCKTVLDCKTWSQPKILNCMRGVDRTLKDYECVYQYRSNRCNTTYEGKPAFHKHKPYFLVARYNICLSEIHVAKHHPK